MPKELKNLPKDADQALDDPDTQTDPAPDTGSGKDGEGGSQTDPQNEKKYSDADLDGIIAKKLASKRAVWEKEFRAKLEKEKDDGMTEAEKLKNMTELQRAQYEAKKVLREKEELEEKVNYSEQMSIARSELTSAGIVMSDELLGMFVSSDADKTMGAIEKLKELWPQEVNAAVQNALKRNPPAAEKDPTQTSFGTSFAEKYNKKMNGGK